MNKIEKLITYFDSPEKDSFENVKKDSNLFSADKNIVQIMEGFPDLAIILNKNRQIVHCNSKALEMFKADNISSVIGKRFGEAFNCIHNNEIEAGCGTSLFCRECGAAKAIKKSRENQIQTQDECRINALDGNKEIFLDLFVKVQPIEFKGYNYSLFAVKDISHEKRRENLERIFFHDVLNTAGAINGLASLLPMATEDKDKYEITRIIANSSKILLNVIQSQRELKYAEDGKLKVTPEYSSVNKILKYINEIYNNSDFAKDKYFTCVFRDDDIDMHTDFTLIVRSLENLVRNAFEATQVNGTIKIFSETDGDYISFKVFNDTVIPQNVRVQIFQRSFSTKASKGRGFGLYSVKLIAEQYLRGNVYFISDDVNKTIFTLRIPISHTD